MCLQLMKARLLTVLRTLIATALLSLGPALPAGAADDADTEAAPVHDAIQQADATREQEKQRKRYLLLFPAAVVVITAGLIFITRRRK